MEKVLDPNHLKTLTAKENLAMAYLEIGGESLSTANKLMEEVLEQRRERLGKEQPYTLMAISNLALIKTALNHTTEAEQMLLAAIPIAERNLGVDHFGTLAGRFRLARVYVRQQRYAEAEDIFTNVVQRHRYASALRKDGDHPLRILAMYHLMLCYQQQKKIDGAIRICDELSQVLRVSVHPIAQQVRDKREELRGLYNQLNQVS